MSTATDTKQYPVTHTEAEVAQDPHAPEQFHIMRASTAPKLNR